MPGVSGTIDVNIAAKLSGAADLGTPVAPVRVAKHLQIDAGTVSLGQADILWADERTLAASATENLDLAGVIAGLLGSTIAAAEITAIYVEADAGNTNDVVLFGAASNAFNGPLSGTTPKLTVGPGDCALITNRKGWTVTAGTGDIILAANSGGTTGVTYRIVVFGRTVAA
jgi:hypothetical protein